MYVTKVLQMSFEDDHKITHITELPVDCLCTILHLLPAASVARALRVAALFLQAAERAWGSISQRDLAKRLRDARSREMSAASPQKLGCGQDCVFVVDSTHSLLSFDGRTADPAGFQNFQNRVRSVACGPGGGHTIFTTLGGAAFGLGSNEFGELGIGTLQQTYILGTPRRVLVGEEMDKVSCGRSFSVGRAVSGNVYSWGVNTFGNLLVPKGEREKTPQLVANLSASDVSAGDAHTLVAGRDGSLFASGCGYCGETGCGQQRLLDAGAELIPIGEELAYAVSAGEALSLVLTRSGAVFAMGDNSRSRLGIEGNGCVLSPTRVPCDRSCIGRVKEVFALENGCGLLTERGEAFRLGNPSKKLRDEKVAHVFECDGLFTHAFRMGSHHCLYLLLTSGRLLALNEMDEELEIGNVTPAP